MRRGSSDLQVSAPTRGPALVRAIEGERRPCALVDLQAFDRNLDRLLRPLGGLTLRVASKSLRVPALLRRVLERNAAIGILTFHAAETRALAEAGFEDLLLAYPPGPEDLEDLVAASEHTRVRITVDGTEVIDALARTGAPLELCFDIDLSLRLGPAHLGVRRSPIRSPEDAVALARRLEGTQLKLTTLLAYEAQIAGIQDTTGSLLDLPMRLIKRRSRPLALQRRAAILAALREHADIDTVNGGGTGSIDFTAGDPSVTEVSAGSGLYCPHLFDGYRGLELEPAAFFALAVVRHSDPGFSTLFGGGFSASGAAGPDRLPRIWWPEAKPLDLEGFGEVQTPVRADLPWGSTVLCRHAKAGELMEHFALVHLIEGGSVVQTVETYRGWPAGQW